MNTLVSISRGEPLLMIYSIPMKSPTDDICFVKIQKSFLHSPKTRNVLINRPNKDYDPWYACFI